MVEQPETNKPEQISGSEDSKVKEMKELLKKQLLFTVTLKLALIMRLQI